MTYCAERKLDVQERLYVQGPFTKTRSPNLVEMLERQIGPSFTPGVENLDKVSRPNTGPSHSICTDIVARQTRQAALLPIMRPFTPVRQQRLQACRESRLAIPSGHGHPLAGNPLVIGDPIWHR